MSNPFQAVIDANRAALEDYTRQGNEIVQKIKSVDNQEEVLSDFIASSEDEQVAQYRQFVDETESALLEAEKEIKAYVSQNLMPKNEGDVDVEAETEKWKKIRETVKALTTVLKSLPDTEKIVEDLPKLDSLGRNSGGTAGQGEGGHKPRVTRILLSNVKDPENVQEVSLDVTQKDGTVKRQTTLTVLAAKLNELEPKATPKLDPATIREHADQVVGAGKDNWKKRNGEPFSFVIAHGENNYNIELTPSK